MRRPVWLSLLVFGVFVCPAGAKAQTTVSSQNPPVNSLPATATSASEWGRFEIIFAALSEKYQTAIVCESAPFQPTLSSEATVALQKQIGIPPLSKQKVITTAAAAFDYEPLFVDIHTVLFFKRYSHPQDLPEITLDEAALFLNHLVKETAPFTSGETGASIPGLVVDLLKNATPEQRIAYASGGPWESLPTNFQNQFETIQNAQPINSGVRKLERIANRLNGVGKTDRTVFRTAEYFGLPFTVYEGPFQSPRTQDLDTVVLSKFLQVSAGGGTSYRLTGTAYMVNNKVIDPVPDPTTPSKEERRALLPTMLACQRNLKQAADNINAQITRSGTTAENTVRADVPVALQQKTVSLFGAAQYLSPLQQIKAIAQVIGLRGVQGKDGTAKISLPAVRVLNSAVQIPGEVIRLMPASLLHAMRGPSGVDTASRPLASAPPSQYLGERYPAKANALYTESVKRLRIMVEPMLLDAKGKNVSLSQVPTEAKSLIALSSLTSDENLFSALINLPPPFFPTPLFRKQASFKIYRKEDNILFEFNGSGRAMNIVFVSPP